MNYKFVSAFLLSSAVCTASFVMADETLQENSAVYTLGEIIVTGETERSVESIASNREITSLDIERSHVRTLDEALKLVPGVYIRTGAQGVPRVDIRGMRSRHVVLLLNGVPINSTYDGQFDPSIISVEKIAKIKVSYGNSSVLYDQGGLGGVINIITKKGTEGLNGSVSAELDENGDPSGNASVSGGTERFDFFVSGSAVDSDGFNLSDDFHPSTFEDGSTRENSDHERKNLFANAGFQASDDLSLGVSLGYNRGEYGLPPSIWDKKKDNDDYAKSVKYERVEDYIGHYANVNIDYQVNPFFGLKSWVYYNDQETDRNRYDDDTYTTINDKGSYALTDDTAITGATIQGSLDYDAYGSFTASVHMEENDYDSAGYVMVKDSTPEAVDITEEIQLYSLAGEYSLWLSDALELVLGYSHHWQNKESGDNENTGNYLLGLSYDLSDATRLRASYARKTRFASVKNLYDPSSGNAQLSPEESDNYEIGITQTLPWDIEADLAFFYNEVENYIAKDANDVYQNNDEYLFQGVELTLTKEFEQAFVQLGYSYLDTEDKSPGSTIDELEYRPKHKITLRGRYDFTFGLKASADILHLVDQYHYDNDGLNKAKLDDITVVNLKMEQSFYHDMLGAYAGVDNIFDEDYEESYGFPCQGRLVYAGLKYTF